MIEEIVDKSEVELRAKRLKYLRQITGLTMKEFSERCNVGFSTLNYWENAVGKGITERGIRHVIAAARREGVACDEAWLREGEGEIPKVADFTKLSKFNAQSIKSLSLPVNENSLEHLQEEVALFQKRYPNSLIQTINDEAMLPAFQPGDVVGGVLLPHARFELAMDKDCIVDCGDNHILIRRVKSGNYSETFSLSGLNLEAIINYPPLNSIKVVALAPIIRVWRNFKR